MIEAPPVRSLPTAIERDDPIFIGGLDRSGKTLLRGFLASHPNISIPAIGSNMWTYFYGQYGDLTVGRNFQRCLDAMLRYKHVAFLQPDPVRIRREFQAGPATYPRLFALIQAHAAERIGKPRWGDQSGLIERYADQIMRAYPRARIIQMIRDPRDRYEAASARWPGGRAGVGGAAARWLYSTRLADRNARRHPDRYLVVRYETLVQEPEQTIRAVCAFVGEPFLPEMLRMEGAEGYRDKLRQSADADGPAFLTTEFVGRFRGRVRDDDIAFIQLVARRMMTKHGYGLDRIGWSRPAQLRFALLGAPAGVLRMASWFLNEQVQQRLPAVHGRRPSADKVRGDGADLTGNSTEGSA